ncbi:hypothetical protein D9M69_404130 [compost metagenome]
MRGLEARQLGQAARQVAGAGQGEELPRVAEDDAVEAGHQAEQADPHQHVHPGGVVADHGFHRLGQRVVDSGKLAPVAHAAGHDHHADGEEHQGQDAGDVGTRNGAFRVLGFFRRHGRTLDGEEEPDGERDGGEDAGNGVAAELVGAGPAIDHEVAEAEARRHHAHEHQQLGHRQDGHHQLEGGGDADAEDVQGHEHEVGAHGGVPRVQLRILHVEVGADGHGDGRRGEDELDQGGDPGNQPALLAEGAAAVGEGAAGMGNGGGQFGEAEDEAGVHGCHQQRGDQEAEGAGGAPAIAPAEVLTGYHQAHGDAPEMQGSQRWF